MSLATFLRGRPPRANPGRELGLDVNWPTLREELLRPSRPGYAAALEALRLPTPERTGYSLPRLRAGVEVLSARDLVPEAWLRDLPPRGASRSEPGARWAFLHASHTTIVRPAPELGRHLALLAADAAGIDLVDELLEEWFSALALWGVERPATRAWRFVMQPNEDRTWGFGLGVLAREDVRGMTDFDDRMPLLVTGREGEQRAAHGLPAWADEQYVAGLSGAVALRHLRRALGWRTLQGEGQFVPTGPRRSYNDGTPNPPWPCAGRPYAELPNPWRALVAIERLGYAVGRVGDGFVEVLVPDVAR